MQRSIVILLLISSFYTLTAQVTISGKVTDAVSGEALIGATIILEKGQGTTTDIDGNYVFNVQPGERNLTVSYVGYQQVNKKVTISKKLDKYLILNLKQFY